MGDFVSWVLIIALIVAWLRSKRDRERDRELWDGLQFRVNELEKNLAELRRRLADRSATTAAAVDPITPEKVAAPSLPPVEPLRTEPTKPQIIEFPASAPVKPSGPPAAVQEPTPEAFEPAYQAGTPDQPKPPLFTTGASAQRGLVDRLKGGLDLEEALGSNWLNKIGIVILVIGVALFLAYQLRQVGPAGKALVGVVVSLALLGAGIWFERKPGYRILGHAGIGGGWALSFFTAYAMYHVEATRVFSTQLPDLILMAIVAAAMVLHTLRYRSQVVTGLAFLLAFTTLPISQVTVFSLVAELILAVGLVVIVGRMRWFELEIFGIVAAYGAHWWWVSKIIEPMGEAKHPFPEFFSSIAILLCYWATFRVSYVLRECDESQERVSTIAALLNSALLLAVMKYQSVHPEWAFWALLALGSAELILGILPITRRLRKAFLILATIGVTLLVAALPFRFSGSSLVLLWMLEAETLMIAGIIVRELLFRRLGLIASVLAPVYLLVHDTTPLLDQRFGAVHSDPAFHLAWLFFFAAGVFYFNSHYVLQRWPDLFEEDVDHLAMYGSSFVGGALLLIGLWVAFPGIWIAPLWALAGLLLLVAGTRFRIDQLSLEACAFALCAFLAALNTNLAPAMLSQHRAKTSLLVCMVAVLFYLSSYWNVRFGAHLPGFLSHAPVAYRWAAFLLLLFVAPCAFQPLSIAPAWVVLALVLLEAGLALGLSDLLVQCNVALAGAFGAIFFINLNGNNELHGISARMFTVIPVMLALYYVYVRFTLQPPDAESRLRVAIVSAWCGTVSLVALLRFELPVDWVAAGWALSSVALLAVAWYSRRSRFLQQALVLAVLSTFRAALHNLYERSNLPGPFWSSRAVCTGATAAVLFSGLLFAFRLRRREESESAATASLSPIRRAFRRPEQFFFFLPLGLIVALLAIEMRHGLITVSWSALGVLVFLFALWVGERTFRLAGLGLLLLGVGKIVAVDVWDLNPRDRYLTFIVMGCALLLVSYLYSRYREAIQRYL